MGPPLISGGNWRRCAGDVTTLRFNGAAADQRRKRTAGRRPLHGCTRFNGAAADQRRKPRDPHGLTAWWLSFNGAAADQRRKRSGGSDAAGLRGFNGAAADQRRKLTPSQDRIDPGASMGPPLISGGNHRHYRSLTDCSIASMGPPLISGGNCPASMSDRPCSASMGPPLISGGNRTGRRHTRRDRLQWGRR